MAIKGLKHFTDHQLDLRWKSANNRYQALRSTVEFHSDETALNALESEVDELYNEMERRGISMDSNSSYPSKNDLPF